MGYDSEMKINGLKIDPRIFTFGFGCQCNGECCHYGVYADLKEYENIISIKDKILPLLDATQPSDITSWFEEPSKDEDFISGFAVGTQLYNNKCVFLDKEGLCTLQKLANLEGKHKWEYKPIYCVLFPFTVYEGFLTIDDDHINRLGHCNKKNEISRVIYDYCKDELEHFLGKEAFVQLEALREEYMKTLNNIEA